MRINWITPPVFCLIASSSLSMLGVVRALSQTLSYKSVYNYSRTTNIIRQQGSSNGKQAVTRTISEMSSNNNNANGEQNTTEESWRILLEKSITSSRKIRGSNYVQIATANENGEPRCRTVVFRGFLNTLPDTHPMVSNNGGHYCDEKPCVMKMCTDLRSSKVQEIAYQSIGEMCWWFPKSSEQYRIRGSFLLVGNEYDDNALQIARKELWGNLSDPARESFLLDDEPSKTTGGRDDEGKVVPPPENFLLMLLDPIHVDYLNLTGNQYRQIDERRQHCSNNDEDTAANINKSQQPYWSSREVDP